MAAGMSFACLTESILRGLLSLAGSVLRSLLGRRCTESTTSSLLRRAGILSILLRLLTIVSVNTVLKSISLIVRRVIG